MGEDKAIGAENINIGPCTVTYDSVDLGLTKGGVQLEVETDTYDTVVDQFGDTPVFSTIIKRSVMVTVPMVETTLDNLLLTMPGSTMVVDGTDPGKRRIDIDSGVGTDLLKASKVLILHPVSEDNSPLPNNKDVTIPLASTGGSITFAYEANEERIFNVEFMGFVNTDQTSPDYQRLLSIGDPTAAA